MRGVISGFETGAVAINMGIGTFIKELDAAGIPVTIKATRSTGGLMDALALIKAGSSVPHILCWRRDITDTSNNDVPSYAGGFREAKAEGAGRMEQAITAFPKELDKNHIWVEIINEPNKDKADWIGWFLVGAAEVALSKGWKLMGPGWSAGEPEPIHWKTEGMREYLTLCQKHPDQLWVAIHEYSLDPTSIQTNHPWMIGRVSLLNTACREMSLKPPNVMITEWGWTFNNIPATAAAIEQIDWANAWYAKNAPNVKGCAIWTLQNTANWGGIAKKVNGLMDPLAALLKGKDYEGGVVPDPTPEEIKFVEFVYPQDASDDEIRAITNVALGEYRRTVGGSIDHAIAALTSPVARPDSYIVVWEPKRQPNSIPRAEQAGVIVQARSLYGNPSHPLDGVDFGYIFRVPFVRTSPFNAIREYGRHEGIDFDVTTAGPSSEPVLCVYSGTVERSLDSAGGYGRYVRVSHTAPDGTQFYTRYAHLDQRYVNVGQQVAKGDPLGEVGMTGNVTGEHVHFNIEIPGYGLSGYVVPDVVDPALYLGYGTDNNVIRPPVQGIDLFNYIYGDGRMFELRHHDGRTETVQFQREADGFGYLVKNSQYEQFRIDADYIWRGIDTSPGPAPAGSERPGAMRYYIQAEPKQSLARWCKRRMFVGETFTGTGHRVQFYYKSDCALSGTNSGWATNRVTFAAHHPTKTFNGITLRNVAEMRTNTNETMFFAEGFGLVGWTNGVQTSAISEILSGRPSLTRERIGCL